MATFYLPSDASLTELAEYAATLGGRIASRRGWLFLHLSGYVYWLTTNRTPHCLDG